jgi:hypothetical protein
VYVELNPTKWKKNQPELRSQNTGKHYLSREPMPEAWSGWPCTSTIFLYWFPLFVVLFWFLFLFYICNSFLFWFSCLYLCFLMFCYFLVVLFFLHLKFFCVLLKKNHIKFCCVRGGYYWNSKIIMSNPWTLLKLSFKKQYELFIA